MTIISVGGVAVGVMALIIVLSVMGGFERELRRKMLQGLPHLEVLSARNALEGFSLNEHPLAEFEEAWEGASRPEPFTQGDVVLKQGKHLSAVVLFGIDPDRGGRLWGFYEAMDSGDVADLGKDHLPLISMSGDDKRWPGILLGSKLAGQLGADFGDEITVLSPHAATGSSLLSGGTASRTFVLVGTFTTGLFNYDGKWAVVNLDEGRRFMLDYDPSMDADRYVSGVAVNVPDPDDVERWAANVNKYKDLKTHTWKETNASLLFALKLEKFTMGSILMLIVLVAAFSISGTMMMTVFHKKRQVCLLRSIGMSRSGVVKFFLIQAFTICSAGIAIGLSLGLGACVLIHNLRDQEMPPDLHVLTTFPVRFLPVDYGVICIVALFLGIAGALYPALTASRQDPGSGLRY